MGPTTNPMDSNLPRLLTFRLKPKQDLAKGIEDFVFRNQIKAAVVVSCVGSLEKATLRMANPGENSSEKGGERIKTRTDSGFEIISLTGTVEWNPGESTVTTVENDYCCGFVTRHLHLSLSDCTGAVWGGHMLSERGDGCTKEYCESLLPVFTTAEVTLMAHGGGVRFSREKCEASGWPELVVRGQTES